MTVIQNLFHLVRRVDELPDGYAFSLPSETDALLLAAEFVALERLCCPFFDFRLEVEREGGEVRLILTGREGVKPFIQAEVGQYVSQIVLAP